MKRNRKRRLQSIESLESRCLLAVGPLIHAHNENQLAVVDAKSGELERIANLSGFFAGDQRMADIAFSPTGRLYGITSNRMYEVHPVSGQLTHLGLHEIANANSLVFEADGALLAMGRNDSVVYEITFSDTQITQTRERFTLSGLEAGEGANGDIAMLGSDLLVASTDNRLLRYRADVNPDRPRIISEFDFSDLDIAQAYGLAVTDMNQIAVTTDVGVALIDLSNPAAPTGTAVELSSESFGDLRGAAYYAESGGPVPLGTVAGTKWHDVNGDGVQQATEAVLTDWQVYIDSNVNGVFDVDEPMQMTDAKGRYHFFGLEPGMYTVDELIPNPNAWEQTFPKSSHRNLAAVYSFDAVVAENQLFHDSGLPALASSFVNMLGDGSVILLDGQSFLELPVSLGDGPFSIAIDATYASSVSSDKFLVSQRDDDTGTQKDFQLSAAANSLDVVSEFCNGAGDCTESVSGTVTSGRAGYGITWDGEQLGAFAEETLVTGTVSGIRPDIDGDVVRFGDPIGGGTPAALQGSIHEIRIYNTSLSEGDLTTAFSTPETANAYTVYVDDTRGVDGMDFGNREPIVVVLAPEIEVRRDNETGAVLPNNASISLGQTATIDDAPSIQFFVHNVGNQRLNLTNVDVTDGFEITGNLASSVQPSDVTSFFVTLTDRTPGAKSGTLTITNDDADENPFVVNLTTELIDLDLRPRQLLINTTAGNLLRIDRINGSVDTLMTGLPSLTDIAHHPTENRLLGIDNTRLYELNLASSTATPLFTHGMQTATALGFSPLGQLFAAGTEVVQIDLVDETVTSYGPVPTGIAGDLDFVGTQMLMSADGGNLYAVEAGQADLIGNSSNVTLGGLAATDADTLFGFSSNQTFELDTSDATLSPLFNRFIFSIAGATFQPAFDAHNNRNPFDVDDDGNVVPFDALLIINELNNPQFTHPDTRQLISPPTGDAKYPDVDDDGFVTPFDALMIINHLNSQAVAARAAGPSPAIPATPASAVDAAINEVDGGLDSRLLSVLAANLDDDRLALN